MSFFGEKWQDIVSALYFTDPTLDWNIQANQAGKIWQLVLVLF